MAPSRRETITGWGTFLVALLAYVVPLGRNVHEVRFAQMVAAAFVLYLVVPPAWKRAATWFEMRRRARRLAGQWSAFRARVTTFRDFFTPDKTSGLLSTIRRTSKTPVLNYDHTLQIEDFLALLDALSAHLARDVQDVPGLKDARRIIRDFESLLPRIESRGVRSLLQLTEARLDGFFAAYATFRQSYREFATEANVRVGDALFDCHDRAEGPI